MILYLSNFKFDPSDELDAIGWGMVQKSQEVGGKTLIELPWTAKRPTRISYDFTTLKHCRVSEQAPGEEFYDFVIYAHSRLKTGYFLYLVDSEGRKLCDPLPPPPSASPINPELSASAQAVEWLKGDPGRTHAMAALVFGLERATVTQAVMRDKARRAASGASGAPGAPGPTMSNR